MFADLAGKTDLITGAGKKTGIGYGIAQGLADAGANVVVQLAVAIMLRFENPPR